MDRKKGWVAGTIFVIAVLMPLPGITGTGDAEDCDDLCRRELARARSATEKYWNVSVATDDGFAEASGCGSTPQGALGIEYTNASRALDQSVEVEAPETVIYMPEWLGTGRRLVAVEYSVPVLQDGLPYAGSNPPDPGRVQPPPELFGRSFDGPAPGRAPAMPWRYLLRVWLFSPNPEGLFAQANPTEACTGADLVVPHVVGEDCHEVHSFFLVEASKVRPFVPDAFTLRVDGDGRVQIAVRTMGCRRHYTPLGNKDDVKITLLDAQVEPPDWPGDGTDVSLYLFGLVIDNQAFVEWAHEETGDVETVAFSDQLERDLTAVVGATGDYVFRSPDFLVEATVAETAPPAPAHLPPVSGRAWFETPRGMGYAKIWHPSARIGGSTDARVTPVQGTLLAELLGCAAGAGSCEPVPADLGAVLTWDRNAAWATVFEEFWNPRHDLLGAGGAEPHKCDKECRADLARARAATERYRDVSAALAEGFVETSGCTDSSKGTFGIRYAHSTRGLDQDLNVEDPEALIYVPEFAGAGRRLTALEYSVPVHNGSEPPRLFGRQLSQSEGGKRYVLRMWLYSDNPDGLFAPANPAEACSAEGLVDWHGQARKCLEVFGLFPADAARLRALVPKEFELRKDPKDPTGNTAQLAIGGNHCASADIRDGPRAEPMLVAHYMVMLEPHDWVGVDPLGNRYMLGLIFNDHKVAGVVRKGMGVGPGVVRSSPDVARDFDPEAGSDYPAYRFSSPDYELRAAMVDPGFEDGGSGAVRFWHKTPRGMAKLHIWIDNIRLAPAEVEITATPGTLVAELLGCDTDPCPAMRADIGQSFTWKFERLRWVKGGSPAVFEAQNNSGRGLGGGSSGTAGVPGGSDTAVLGGRRARGSSGAASGGLAPAGAYLAYLASAGVGLLMVGLIFALAGRRRI